MPLLGNDRREKGIFQEHINQCKTSKPMLPRRKREPREEILKQSMESLFKENKGRILLGGCELFIHQYLMR